MISRLSLKKAPHNFLINLAALVIGAVLFAASFPNLIFANGLPLLAWIAYIPVFWVVRRAGFGACVFFGAFYGYAAYGLFNYWLSVFHPLAGLIVGSIYLFYFAVLFPFLRLAALVFPGRGYLLQWLLWMAFEYLRTQGFLGYSYGVAGYSQWHLLPLIQIADLAGVWGISALVVFPSAWLAAALSDSRSAGGKIITYLRKESNSPVLAGSQINHTKTSRRRVFKNNISPSSLTPIRDIEEKSLPADLAIPFAPLRLCVSTNIKAFLRREWVSALIWLLLLVSTLVYGFASQIDYSGAREVKVALVQHNTDPWQPSKAATFELAFEEYRKDFRILRRLSDEALAAHPDTDLVVWSETAFVPRIHWHTTVRDDPASWELVRELLDYLGKQKVPFVIGNDDARKEPAINPHGDNRVDYNAVMLYEEGRLKTIYRKLHLVPFTEHFPYEKQLPWIYTALRNADTHFWEKGGEATVFESAGVKFSTPICFEDTFGYLSRDFVLNGAELIVNLSNDAWSNSLPAQMQHLSMAVFRAVENRRSMVRSTASGQTCAIDPNGKILAMAEPFTEAWLSASVPVVTPSAIYTRYGDYLGRAFTWAAFFLLIAGLFPCIINLIKRRHAGPA